MSNHPVTGRQLARVLVAHCSYREPGGEDVAMAAEVALLRDHGHEVETFERFNRDLPATTLADKAHVAARTVWSRTAQRELRTAIDRFQPDVVHVHNTFLQLSPAVYRTCAARGVPVVQTLHNYRYGCVSANLFRDGRRCVECVGRAVPWPGVQHGCYRDSRAESATIAAMTSVHRAAGSWSCVDRFIATSDAARRHFVAMGLPAERIAVKPNFVADAGTGPQPGSGDALVFAGRLIAEKGVIDLVEAARRTDAPLQMLGDGPLRHELATRAAGSRIELLGGRPHADVAAALRNARAVVVPSLWDEPFGLVVIEAFAVGVPAIVYDRGALPELVDDGTTGWVVPGGDVDALAAAMSAAAGDPDEARRRGTAAYDRYRAAYTAEVNYRRLTDIYAEAIGGR